LYDKNVQYISLDAGNSGIGKRLGVI
jgi:hypothetical protein